MITKAEIIEEADYFDAENELEPLIRLTLACSALGNAYPSAGKDNQPPDGDLIAHIVALTYELESRGWELRKVLKGSRSII